MFDRIKEERDTFPPFLHSELHVLKLETTLENQIGYFT